MSALPKMTQKMTSCCLLSATLLVVLLLWRAQLVESQQFQKDPELVALDDRCKSAENSQAILPHPGMCHLYFNCSDSGTVIPWHFTPHLKECRYPQLFSTVTNKCEPFDGVSCGQRTELVTHCEYYTALCPGFMCRHCNKYFPSCKGLPDGVNPFQGVSPYYSVCRSQRTVASRGTCPRHPKLDITQLVHPVKRHCVSVYEISKKDGGAGLSCTGKADGLHLDDVTNRPDVYFRCFGGKLLEVLRCDGGQYFDQVTAQCAAKPLYNRIMTPDEPGPM